MSRALAGRFLTTGPAEKSLLGILGSGNIRVRSYQTVSSPVLRSGLQQGDLQPGAPRLGQ